jgi:hypothetical protein
MDFDYRQDKRSTPALQLPFSPSHPTHFGR